MAEKTIASQIEQDAIDGVQSFTVDGMSGTVMPIDDRIKADQYVKQQAAKARNHAGLSFRTLKPGGCG